MSSCILRALNDRLLTKKRLLRFQFVQNSDCVLCDAGIEDIDHIFFSCPFSSYVWFLCRLKLTMPADNQLKLYQEALLIKNKFKQKTKVYQLSRLVLTAAVWQIWLERNRRVFQYKSLHKILVFRNLYEDISILLKTCNWKVGANPEHMSILLKWGIDCNL